MANTQDLDLVKAALAGEPAACAEIRSPEMTSWIEAVLVKRGASQTEAKDITADVFGDCFTSRNGRAPLLRAYNGGGALRAFLSRAALNRLIDLKRRQRFHGELSTQGLEGAPVDEFDLLEGEDQTPHTDDNLVKLLRDALLHAFSQCNPRDLVLMRLVAIYGVRQEALATALGWSQSKVSRTISGVMEEVRARTMEEVRKADPWLEVEWADFIALCRSSADFLVGASAESQIIHE